MLIILVPTFFIFFVFVFWFLSVHVSHNSLVSPLFSRKIWHLDVNKKETPPTEFEENNYKDLTPESVENRLLKEKEEQLEKEKDQKKKTVKNLSMNFL